MMADWSMSEKYGALRKIISMPQMVVQIEIMSCTRSATNAMRFQSSRTLERY